MQPDSNKIFGIFGQRNSGKTDFTKGNATHKIPGLVNTLLKTFDRGFIIDTFDHPSWRHLPILTRANFSKHTSGLARSFVDRENIPDLLRFIRRQKNIWNSFIIFEDAYKHTKYTVNQNLIELIADSKNKNIDIGFMYHAFGQAPPDLYDYFDYIELFKTKDSPKDRKANMPGYYEEAVRVYEQVKASPNPFEHKTINTGL